MRTDPFISVRGLGMRYFSVNDSAGMTVLRDISFDVTQGEFVCIVGPSGGGKSTLLNLFGGFLSPSEGEILVNRKPVRGPSAERLFIFQDSSLFPWLTVAENISLGARHRTPIEREAIVEDYLRRMGLSGFARAYPRELSGGMRQRVELARALAAGPEVLYMDEPFGALDFITRMNMRNEIVRVWQVEKKTIFFVTHDLEEAVQIADRIIVMGSRTQGIQADIRVTLPRPRDVDSPDYLATRDRLYRMMGISLKVGQPVE